MEDDHLAIGSTKSRPVKQGRRAKPVSPTSPLSPQETEDVGILETNTASDKTSQPDGPPVPAKRMSGWGEETPKRRRNLGEGFEQFEDERLRPRSAEKEADSESDSDIPVIPDLEDQQDDDLSMTVAVAPNVAVNRVATYRELDNDLLAQAAFLTLDNSIDLKLLTKCLCSEADLVEPDQPWEWDQLFTEVTSQLISQEEESTDPQEKEATTVR